MKKLLLLPLSLSILFATTATKKQQILDKYTVALKAYKDKNYKQSYNLLNELFLQNLNNVNINFYLARSSYELKKYHEAIIAYERVLFEKPNDIKTQFELARTHLANRSYGESKQLFLKLYNNKNLQKSTKNTIIKYLSFIDKKIKKNFFNGVAIVGLNYDSNINNTPIPHSFDTFNLSTKKTGDWALQFVGMLNHKYKYKDNILVKNDFMAFLKKMQDNSSKDISMFSYTPTINYKYTDKLNLDYFLFIDTLYIDHKSTQNSYGFGLKTYLNINKKLFSISSLKYQNKQSKISLDQDSTYIELSQSLKYLKRYSFDFLYASERKNQGNVATIDKDIFNFKVSNRYKILPKLMVTPTLSYKKTNYKDNILFTNLTMDKRVDNEYKFTINSTYLYNKQWIYQFNADYTKNNSNNLANRYNKNTITFNIIRPF